MVIDTQLVTVSIDTTDAAGVAAGFPKDMSCILTLGEYTQTRSKVEYPCMSSNNSTVGLGSITRTPLALESLYTEATTDGQDILKTAFDTNEAVWVSIEFNNKITPVTGNGTTLEGLFKVQTLSLPFPKDGKIGANFTLEFMKQPTLTPAT